MFVPYVICNSEKENAYLSEKAFHPEELIASKGKLSLDHEWYIVQQILPVITRLIEHIEGIEIDYVTSCFGLDAKKYAKIYTSKRDTSGNEFAPQQD